MRIVLLGDFKYDNLRNVQHNSRKMYKGFTRNGHDVMPLSFRNLMLQLSPIKSKRWAFKLAKKSTDRLCVQLLKDYQPDLVIVMSFRNLDGHTLRMLRDTLPDTRFLGWYPDSLDGVAEFHLHMMRQLHWLLATGSGPRLADILKQCGIPGGFMPNPCDPDIEKPYEVSADYLCDVLFTGKLAHRTRGTDSSREELIKLMREKFNLKLCGAEDSPTVLGLEYYYTICGAKIALSINATNDIVMYHSDRLINYLGCGAFVLAKNVPDSNLLFEDGKHIRYFSSARECIKLTEYYLTHPEERKAIAARGMNHTHRMFNCQRIAGDIIDYITNGTYDAPWAQFYNNANPSPKKA